MGGDLRICSLLPSSTEILYALGLDDQVIAVTHECDFPPQASQKPRVTENLLDDHRLTSAQIDHHVSSNIGRHGSIYRLREDLLAELKPNLIITQELCDVCAVSYKDVERASRVLEGETRIIFLEPNTLDEGIATGRKQEAVRLMDTLRARIKVVVERQPRQRPRVLCLEWLDPPFVAGHWVPEMVEIAGGQEILGKVGRKSERIHPEQIIEAQPEIIVLMPCGFLLQRTIEEYHRNEFFPGWKALPAAINGQVYAVDGSSYFNRSGPRLIDGVEILASIFHPNRGTNVTYQHFKKLP